jgi:ABC-type branched-subunit amino acid transport system ATPase component
MNPLFADFTVLQNVLASFHLHPKSSLFDVYFGTAKYRKNEAYILERSLQILRMVGIEKIKDELAKNLSHGYQKMLGVARALATSPRLLLLDEPLTGMTPSEIEFSLNYIEKLRKLGMTVLVVEHNMQILKLCDRVVVVSFGEKIGEGSPEEIKGDQRVISAYLGSEYAT